MNATAIYQALVGLFLPVTLAIGLLGTLFVTVAGLAIKPRTAGFPVFLMAFGFLGGVAGLIAGGSRESVVGALLTGLLGIITALLSYLFGKDSLIEWRPYIPYAVMLLVISALAGLSIGGIYRKEHDEFERSHRKYMLEYEKVYLEVLKEQRLLKVREDNKKSAVAVEPATPKGKAASAAR